jgi:16S rRNA G527 N7-methylase RsmG
MEVEPEVPEAAPEQSNYEEQLLDTYNASIRYLRNIEHETKLAIRKIIRRVNKLKNYAKTSEDITAQRAILRKRCERANKKLARLEEGRGKLIAQREKLVEYREECT